MLPFATFAEEEFYGTLSKDDFSFCIIATVSSAVFHLFGSLELGDDVLGGQFAPTLRYILGIAHSCHTEEMEFLMTAAYEISELSTCIPAVYQQVIKWNLVLYRILHHFQQLAPLAMKYSFFRLEICESLSR